MLAEQHPGQQPAMEVRVERMERPSSTEARFQVTITNRSTNPVFISGIQFQDRTTPFPVYLERQSESGSWKVVSPCVDVAPPSVIRLEPAKSIREDFTLKNPLEGVCKEKAVTFKGLFRFRIAYFDSEESASAFLKNFFSSKARGRTALSKAFEIPISLITDLRDAGGLAI